MTPRRGLRQPGRALADWCGIDLRLVVTCVLLGAACRSAAPPPPRVAVAEGAPAASPSPAPAPVRQTIFGQIIDAKCLAEGKQPSAAHAACAIECIQGGAVVAFVEEQTEVVYHLLAPDGEAIGDLVLPHVGRRAEITGPLVERDGARSLVVEEIYSEHEHSPRHGGDVAMSGDTHVEVVALRSGEMRVYLTSAYRKPLPVSGRTGSVEVLDAGGAPRKARFEPDATGRFLTAEVGALAGPEAEVTVRVPMPEDPGFFITFMMEPRDYVVDQAGVQAGRGRGIAAALSGASVVFSCPMHPEVASAVRGSCAKCGMDLVAVAVDPFEEREYRLVVDTEPPAPRVKEPARIRLRVFDPISGALQRGFQGVDGKPFHLFVVSRSLEHFFHAYPERQADGSFLTELTLPEPGLYRLYSDFLPVGGTPQVLVRTLVTAGHTGGLASAPAPLTPDDSLTSTADGTTVSLRLPPEPPVAGREATLRYELRDAATGQPVVDLEPHLAAWGYALFLSEDTREYVHAHPVDWMPRDGAEPRGGPELTFKAFFPRAGNYRGWLEFKRRGRVSIVPFTLRVAPGDIGTSSAR